MSTVEKSQSKLYDAIPDEWQNALSKEINDPSFNELDHFIEARRKLGIAVHPSRDLIFNTLIQTPLNEVSVLILGQDPYHQPNQAEGLAFSVKEGVPLPPSLRNIYKELQSDLGFPPSPNGSLLPWAKQGVLLLNTLLTVEESEPLSHQKKGWERLTDAIVQCVLEKEDPVVFLLWGRHAKDKVERLKTSISCDHHLFHTSAHPSPLSASRGFLGSRPFSKTNEFLQANGKRPIRWVV